jgi:hypothetical protein
MFFNGFCSAPILKAKLKVESRYEIEHATQLAEASLFVHNQWPTSSRRPTFTHDYDQSYTSANVYDILSVPIICFPRSLAS